jgi:membrane AbrB-like protein
MAGGVAGITPGQVVRWAAALAIGALAGYVCMLLRTPIPWMLGPLFALAALRVSGIDVDAPIGARYVGQWVIGTALGLYFTPAVVHHVGTVWYLPIIGAALAIVTGYASGAVLARLGRLDLTTSLFASVPGGAAEMATLGGRYGAREDRVAAAHSLRMLLVVAIVPAAFTLAGLRGSDAYVMGTTQFDAAGFAMLMIATLVGGLIAQRFNVPNAFVLGALFVAIPLTAMEVQLSSLPTVVSNAAQVLLGCSLGSKFQRDFLRGAPRFVGAVVVSVLVSIVLAGAFGAAIALASHQNVATIVLGMAPGGIAEMTITAKVLQLGVPLVTSFHVTRLVVVLLLTGPVFARARAWRRGRMR